MSAAESDAVNAVTCWHCGDPINQKYTGTFWKAPDPMPMHWVHTATGDSVCSFAEPSVTPPAETGGAS